MCKIGIIIIQAEMLLFDNKIKDILCAKKSLIFKINFLYICWLCIFFQFLHMYMKMSLKNLFKTTHDEINL